MFKKLNIRGVSHHFLLPVLAVLVVAGIGGYIMQRSSSAMVPTQPKTGYPVKKCTYTSVKFPKNPAKYKVCKTVNVATKAQRAQIQKATNAVATRFTNDARTYNKAQAMAKTKCENLIVKHVWSNTTNKCTRYIQKNQENPATIQINYCEWTNQVNKYASHSLKCHTTKANIGSATATAYRTINENSWDKCRDFVKSRNYIPGATAQDKCMNLRI